MPTSPPDHDVAAKPDAAQRAERWIDEQMRRMAQRAEIFERILHRSPGILLIARNDEGWPLEYLSSNVERLGYDKQALIDDPDGFLAIVHEDDRDRIAMECDYWMARPDRDDFRLEFRCRDADGHVHWLDTHLWLRRDARGKVRRMQGIAWDITERKRAERLQRLAVHVVELLNCPDESSEIIRNILEMMRFYTEIKAAAIHLLREDGGFDCIESGFERRAPFDPARCPLVASALRRSRHPARCDRCHQDLDDSFFEAGGIHRTDGGAIWSDRATSLPCVGEPGSCLTRTRTGEPIAAPETLAVIPLRAAGEIVGLLQLCDDDPSRCDAETVEAFEGLGFSIGIALDRERATHELQQSEERYRALFDTSCDGIAMLTLDHRIEAANGALESMTGHTPYDLDELTLWTALRSTPRSARDQCVPGQLLSQGFTDDFERAVVRPDVSRTSVMCRAWTVRDESGRPKRTLVILRDIEEQREAEREVHRLVTAIEQSAEIVLVVDLESRIEYVNPAFENVTGYTRDEAVGMSMLEMRHPDVPQDVYEDLLRTIRRGEVFKGRVAQRRKDGSGFHVDQTISPVRDDAGRILNFVAVQRDVTEIMQLESQLLQAQKLESIGRLAAGIAHEINTPSQYVGDNVRFLKDAFDDFMKVMVAGGDLTDAALARGVLVDEARRVKDVVEEIDFEYLVAEIPRAIDQSLDGLGRVSKIVGAMKYFSHPGAQDIAPTDIHQAIESTVTVARNEWKYDSDLEFDFDPSMPLVPCLANELNQVVLNLVINAVHAIQQKRTDADPKGRIVVRTRRESQHAMIAVEDSGTGIPDSVAHRIFDPFFTTKDVGSGTGQGLAIARDVIVGKHGGRIDFRTTPGEGTTFFLRIPLRHDGTDPEGASPCGA